MLYRRAMEFRELLSLVSDPGAGTGRSAHICTVCGADIPVVPGTDVAVSHKRPARQDEFRPSPKDYLNARVKSDADFNRRPCEGSGEPTETQRKSKTRQFYQTTFAQQNIWPNDKGYGGLLREHATLAYDTVPALRSYVEGLMAIAEGQAESGITPLNAFRNWGR